MKHGWHLDAEGQKPDLKLILRLKPFVRPHLKAIAGGFGLHALSAVAKLISPYVLKLAIDGPMARGETGALWAYAALFFALIMAENFLDAVQTVLVRSSGQKMLHNLRSVLFAKSQRLTARYMDNTPGGQTLARLTSDVSVLSDLFSAGIISLLGDIALLGGILVILWNLDSGLAAAAYLALPVLIAVSEVFRRKMRVTFRNTRKKTAILTGRLQEAISGFTTIRLFSSDGWAAARFDDANEDHFRAHLKSVFLYALFFPIIEFASACTIALVVWNGGMAVAEGAVSFGTLVAFFEYLQKFFRPLRDISEKYNVLQASMASIERISEFLDLEEDPPPGDAVECADSSVRLDGVGFGYNSREQVLKGVNLEVAAGKTLAIVGPTGAGKSTIIHLLSGLYRPQEGAVSLGGIPLMGLSDEARGRRVALVPQDVFLFDDTILENIRMGRAWIDEKKALEAAEAVGLDSVVRAYEKGYETRVLEEGVLLSSGQKQLVAFARALAGDPELLLLDEATSEVDQATEEIIEKALESLFSGRTGIVVAHRLATVRRADQIAVLVKGAVAEVGSHQELLENGAVYRKLYELQFGLQA